MLRLDQWRRQCGAGTSYTAEDEDLKGVETDYTRLEDKLRKQIDRIETEPSGL